MEQAGKVMYLKRFDGGVFKKAQKRLMRILNMEFSKLPQFQRGDQIYYIIDPVEVTFARGLVVGADKEGVLIDCLSGGEVKVSPFAIVPNPIYL